MIKKEGVTKAFKQKVSMTIEEGKATLRDEAGELLDEVDYGEHEPLGPLLEYFNFIDFES